MCVDTCHAIISHKVQTFLGKTRLQVLLIHQECPAQHACVWVHPDAIFLCTPYVRITLFAITFHTLFAVKRCEGSTPVTYTLRIRRMNIFMCVCVYVCVHACA